MLKKLSDFDRSMDSRIFNQTFSDDFIIKKDFSGGSFYKLKLLNCVFESTAFPLNSGDLVFFNCTIKDMGFYKAELENLRFLNCKLIDCEFKRSDLCRFRFFNCQLKNVSFLGSELYDCKFYKSELRQVSFNGTLADYLKIKKSTLKDISCSSMEFCKDSYENGVFLQETVKVVDYSSFSKLFEEK